MHLFAGLPPKVIQVMANATGQKLGIHAICDLVPAASRAPATLQACIPYAALFMIRVEPAKGTAHGDLNTCG